MVFFEAMAVAGAGLAVYGAVSGSQSAKKAARRARALARQNAQNIRRQANELTIVGQQRADSEIHAADRAIGTQRTQIAASGIVVDVGSAADVVDGTRLQGAANAANTAINTAREVRNMRQQAKYVEAGGQVDAANLNAQARASLINGGSTVLGIVSNYAQAERAANRSADAPAQPSTTPAPSGPRADAPARPSTTPAQSDPRA